MLVQSEINNICKSITPQFTRVLGLYDYTKYPAADYIRFKSVFSTLSCPNKEIELSLKWKWGHWGKKNYPQTHKDLIRLVNSYWDDFALSGAVKEPKDTFDYWGNALESSTRYITVAYITHLVHPTKIPIIDQHNFRSMNYFLSTVKKNHRANKKPNKWSDIEALGNFIDIISSQLSVSKGDFDKFLMMHGKHSAPR